MGKRFGRFDQLGHCRNFEWWQVFYFLGPTRDLCPFLLSRSPTVWPTQDETSYSNSCSWIEWEAMRTLSPLWYFADAAFQLYGCTFLLHEWPKGRDLLHIQSFLLQILVPAVHHIERSLEHYWTVQAFWGLAPDVRAGGLLPHELAGHLSFEDSIPLDNVRILWHTWSWPAFPAIRQDFGFWEPRNTTDHGRGHLRVQSKPDT